MGGKKLLGHPVLLKCSSYSSFSSWNVAFVGRASDVSDMYATLLLTGKIHKLAYDAISMRRRLPFQRDLRDV